MTSFRKLPTVVPACLMALCTFAFPPPAHAGPPFEVVHTGTWAGFNRDLWQRTVLLARDEQELEAIWRERMGRRDAPPAVDFRRHSVVLYLAGMRPEPGDRYRVDDVRVRGGSLLVEVVELKRVGCVAGQVAVFPLVMITTIPWHGEVELDQRFDSYICDL